MRANVQRRELSAKGGAQWALVVAVTLLMVLGSLGSAVSSLSSREHVPTGSPGISEHSQATVAQGRDASGNTTGDPAPSISSVSFGGSSGDYTLTVNGQGFGSSPVSLPYDGTTSDFRIADEAQLGFGEWGYGGDALALDYQVWTDSQVVVGGFGGSAGDAITLALWNPSTQLGVTWGGNVPGGPANEPQISSVAFSGSGQTLSITVTGTDFGNAPTSMPYTGDLNYFAYGDFANHCSGGSSKFGAGFSGWGIVSADSVTLQYSSWSNTQIVVSGFSGSYGSGCAVVNSGDPVFVTIWNSADSGVTGPQTAWGGFVQSGPMPGLVVSEYSSCSPGSASVSPGSLAGTVLVLGAASQPIESVTGLSPTDSVSPEFAIGPASPPSVGSFSIGTSAGGTVAAAIDVASFIPSSGTLQVVNYQDIYEEDQSNYPGEVTVTTTVPNEIIVTAMGTYTQVYNGILTTQYPEVNGVSPTYPSPSGCDIQLSGGVWASSGFGYYYAASPGSYQVTYIPSSTEGAAILYVLTLAFQSVVTPSLMITGPTSGIVGSSTTLTGSDFTSGQTPTWTFGSTAFTCTSGGTVQSDGSLTCALTVPSESAGAYIVTATDAQDGAVESSNQFTVTPSLSITGPTSGAVGASTTVTGSGFTAGEVPSWTFGTASFACSSGDVVRSDGSIDCAFQVPEVVPGPYYVTATDGVDGSIQSSDQFMVTPSTTFELSATPQSQIVALSGMGTFDIQVQSIGGFASQVALSVPDCPEGFFCQFTSSPVSPGASTILTVTVSAPAAPGGPYPMTVDGASGSLTETVGVSVTVTEVVSVSNTIDLADFNVADSGGLGELALCTAQLLEVVTSCFSIQQNLFVNAPGDSAPSYWVQNVLIVGETALGVDWVWYGYNIFTCSPTSYCPPQGVYPASNLKGSVVFVVPGTVELTSSISGSQLLLSGDFNGFTYSYPYSFPAAGYYVSELNNPILLPQLDLVAGISAPKVNFVAQAEFGSGTSGAVSTYLETTAADYSEVSQNVLECGIPCGSSSGGTSGTSTGETGLDLGWSLNGANSAEFLYQSGTNDEGIGFTLPSGFGNAVMEGGFASLSDAESGVSVDISGSTEANGAPVELASEFLGQQPVVTPPVEIAAVGSYDVWLNVASLGYGGEATVCVTNPDVNSRTNTMEYFSGGLWWPAIQVTVTGTTICGDMPVDVLGGTPLVIGAPSTVQPYLVTFSESGLPAGTPWTVEFSGYGATVKGTTNSFEVSDGSYPYSVKTVDGYTVSPSSGTAVVDGANVIINLTFTPVAFSVIFTESGLSVGTEWTVTLDGTPSTSNATINVFNEPNGSYDFQVPPVAGYTVSPNSGAMTVNGTGVTIELTFMQVTYEVTLSETGLPLRALSLAGWSVVVGGAVQHATVGTVNFTEPNGTYSLLVLGPGGYRSSVGGTLTVSGGPLSVLVSFVKGQTFALSFREKGLSEGQRWCVELQGYEQCAGTSAIKFADLSPGSYGYSVVSPLAGQTVTASVGGSPLGELGTILVDRSESVQLRFAYPQAVTFTENGLTSGTWAVTIEGQTETAAWNHTIQFNLTNGTYGYKVGAISGYTSSGSPKKAVVPTTASVLLTFTAKMGKSGSPAASLWMPLVAAAAVPVGWRRSRGALSPSL